MTTFYDFTARLRLPGTQLVGVFGELDQSQTSDQRPSWRSGCTIAGGHRLGRTHWERDDHSEPPFQLVADWIRERVAQHLRIDPSGITFAEGPTWTPGN